MVAAAAEQWEGEEEGGEENEEKEEGFFQIRQAPNSPNRGDVGGRPSPGRDVTLF